MAIAQRLLGSGTPALVATNIIGDVTSAVTATGSSIADAYDATTVGTEVTTTAASTGLQLIPCNPGDMQWVYNAGASTLSVYPDSALAKIQNGAAGAAFSVATNKGALFIKRNSADYMAILTA